MHGLSRVKESESESGVGVGILGIIGVGVGVRVGILGILGVGVGVGPYTFRLRNHGCTWKFIVVTNV